MNIKFLDLTRQYEKIKHEIIPVVDSIMESQYFINGPIVKEFENNFANFCDTKYAVGCSSGTDALLMSLMALGIGPGHEVITTPFTFFATVEVIVRVGATPVFVDIDEKTFNIDTTMLDSAVTKKTKAIIPVHIFGQCCNMDDVLAVSKKHDLYVIEDSAQAVGATWKNKKAGSMGTVGCFSFFPSKNLGAFGDAGAVVTDNEQLYEKLLRTRQHGIDIKNVYYYEHLGGNFRIDAIQAGVLDIKLKYLEEWSKMRSKNAAFYNSRLSSATTPYRDDNCYHTYNQYVVRSKQRDDLRQRLSSNGISSAIYYPYPIHEQKCISHLGYESGDFPACERACKEVLALPIYPELRLEEMSYIVDVVEEK